MTFVTHKCHLRSEEKKSTFIYDAFSSTLVADDDFVTEHEVFCPNSLTSKNKKQTIKMKPHYLDNRKKKLPPSQKSLQLCLGHVRVKKVTKKLDTN